MTRLSPLDGLPLPELVDFRIMDGKKKVVLFVQEGKAFYTKRLDLKREGAGLWAINPAFQNATFIRRQRTVPASEAQPFERVEGLGAFSLCVSREMAELLARVFWGRLPDLESWSAWEGVQAAYTTHLNAAD